MLYRFDDFRLDAGRRVLSRADGERVPLSPKAFDILLMLVGHRGGLVDKDTLMRAVWGRAVVEENNLNQHVSALRRLLGDTRGEQRYIATLPGRGYQFVANVSASEMEPSAASAAEAAAPRTLIVLPFRALAAEDRSEALELGISETLILRLAASRQLVVRPLAAVQRLHHREGDPVGAARALGASLVLDGSIQRSGERLRVSARLLDVELGRQLWAEQFDERFTDLFDVQDSIAARVSAALALKLSGDERERLTKRHTQNVEAYRLYTLARLQMNRPGPESLTLATEWYRQALRVDAQYALAYAGLSEAYTVLGVFGAMRPHDLVPMARDAATQALALDDQLAEAHMALAHLRVQYDRDWRGAEAAYRRALALEPGSGAAHNRYSIMLMTLARRNEAFAEIERAQELDPGSALYVGTAGFLSYWARRFEQAIALLDLAREMEPQFWMPHYWLAQVHAHAGARAEASLHAELAIELAPAGTLWLRAYVLARAGDTRAARAALDELLAGARTEYVPAYDLAQVYAACGDQDAAFEWLERAFEERSRGMDNLAVNPAFDALRGARRYADLAARMGFTARSVSGMPT